MINDTDMKTGITQVRDVKIEVEFIPGRPKSIGLQFQNTTKVTGVAFKAENCKYVGKNHFVVGDIIYRVGWIYPTTVFEMVRALARITEENNMVSFTVKRDVVKDNYREVKHCIE